MKFVLVMTVSVCVTVHTKCVGQYNCDEELQLVSFYTEEY